VNAKVEKQTELELLILKYLAVGEKGMYKICAHFTIQYRYTQEEVVAALHNLKHTGKIFESGEGSVQVRQMKGEQMTLRPTQENIATA
jgi:hypothetical protein